jgi:hypothetical protein
MISGSEYIYNVNIILFNADLKFPCQLGESDEFGIRLARASSHLLPTARSAGNRVKAADGASFVVFIFLG